MPTIGLCATLLRNQPAIARANNAIDDHDLEAEGDDGSEGI